MKTKYVFHGLIYLHVNFHDNRTMRTVILITKNCRWGGGGGGEEKEPIFFGLWKSASHRISIYER